MNGLLFLEEISNMTGKSPWYVRDPGKLPVAFSGHNLPPTGCKEMYLYVNFIFLGIFKFLPEDENSNH